MTKLFSLAVEEAQKLPPDVQDYLGRALLLAVNSRSEADRMEPEERALVLAGLQAAERGEMATDAEVEAAYRLFDR